ncbi:MAG: FecR family protein, partial [Verrucomicrobiales bacterium]
MKPPLHDASASAGMFARYVEEALSPEELAAFETSLHQDENLRLALADWLHLEGILRAEADTLFQETAAGDTVSRRVIRFPSPWRWAAVAALLCLGVGAGLGRWLRPAPVEMVEKAMPAPAPGFRGENASAVATLADTRACKWGSGSLPTAEGSRLAPGHLELVEGLATLRFDSGATVTLEAPVALEVVDAMECRLERGAAVAWVPEGAQGFRIITPDALLTDYGTRFGVTANEEGNSQVLVLEGEVGVTHHLTPGERLLKTGEMVRY